MKVTVSVLAVAISLAVFACSESPNSPSEDGSSSSGLAPSSSSDGDYELYRACRYSGEMFGVSGPFACDEVASDISIPSLKWLRADCEKESGTLAKSCPKGEKITCIDEENEYYKDISTKVYIDDIACRDLGLKNIDGSEEIVKKGGACGLFRPEPKVPLSACVEMPGLSTGFIKLICADEEFRAPFLEECPRHNADLICYSPEEEVIAYYYGEAVFSLTCEDIDMEEYNPESLQGI